MKSPAFKLQKRFGNKHYVSIFELSLQLALIQSKSNTLGPSLLHGAIKAYSLGYPPDISRLVADWNNSDQKVESNGTKYCVYAHTWIDLLVGKIKSIFDSQYVSERSKKATSLLKKVSKLYKHEQSPTTIALSYFGMTTSPTVKERETKWTYKSNVLMYALWKKNHMKPRTVVVFQIPEKYHKDEYTNQIIAVVEFLLIELFNTYGGIGFNQEPGGRFNSGRADFVTYDECAKLVQDLGISSKSDFRKWCKNFPQKRVRLGIPSDPDQAYKDQGWISWNHFLGTQPAVTEDTKLSYDECAEYIRGFGIKSAEEFRKWCKDNSETRTELGIPSNPAQAYKDIGWINWNHFLGTQPAVTEDTKLPYDECAKYIQGLRLSSAEEFRKWCKDNPITRRAKGIPFNPDRDYKDQGWKDWPAFLLGDKILDIIH